MSEKDPENLRSIYQAHCTQYENLMSRRFSLLTIVPGATVASFAITLFSNPTNSGLSNLIFPLGLAGICFLIGLFCVARISLREGKSFYNRIQQMEIEMGGDKRTSFHEDWLFNQENVASLIFAASFAGWICVALWFMLGSTAAFTTSIVLFFIILILSKIILNSDVPRGDRPDFLQNSSNRDQYNISGTQQSQSEYS